MMPKHEAYGRRHARFAADPDLTETQGRFATGVQAAPEATVGSDDSDQPLGTQLILLLLTFHELRQLSFQICIFFLNLLW